MKILLINPPGTISFISPPLGILYVAASLRDEGHTVSVVNFDITKFDQQYLEAFIRKNSIQVIGISIVTPKVYKAMELARVIKKAFPQIKIFAGGPHATLEPVQLLEQCPEFDFIVQGEAELRIKKIMKALQNNSDLTELDGIAFIKNGRTISNPPKDFIRDLDELPLPAREMIDIYEYARHLKTSRFPATTMMTSRGCPFSCIYCSKPITGTKFRGRSPENVIKEMEILVKDYDIKEIIFYDDSFTLDRERTLKICDLIIKKDIEVRWQCETRVNLVDEELLKKMMAAGCYLIAYGIESGSDRVLGILKKGITTAQVRNAVLATQRAGIGIIGYFMIGIPGETEKEVRQTIEFAKELDVDFAQFSIATAYPSTELYEMAKKENKITEDWSKSIYALGGKPLTSLSKIPIDQLCAYAKKAYRQFYFRPSYILSRVKKIKSPADLFYNLRGLKTLFKI